MWNAILGFVPSLISGVKEYVGKKQDLQKLERSSALEIKKAEVSAKIRRLESADKADTELDKASIGQIPWGDDALLAVVLFPIVVNMASPFVDLHYLSQSENWVYTQGMLSTAVGQGFTELSKAPEYYWWLTGAVTIYVLGMRRMFRQVLEGAVANFKLPFTK